jgi:hypothetical protein
MTYFYIIESIKGRPGFGITTKPMDRIQQYISHNGENIEFKDLYGGNPMQAAALETLLKTQYKNELWMVNSRVRSWKTEWMNDSWKYNSFKEFIENTIAERHFDLKVVVQNFGIKTKWPIL